MALSTFNSRINTMNVAPHLVPGTLDLELGGRLNEYARSYFKPTEYTALVNAARANVGDSAGLARIWTINNMRHFMNAAAGDPTFRQSVVEFMLAAYLLDSVHTALDEALRVLTNHLAGQTAHNDAVSVQIMTNLFGFRVLEFPKATRPTVADIYKYLEMTETNRYANTQEFKHDTTSDFYGTGVDYAAKSLENMIQVLPLVVNNAGDNNQNQAQNATALNGAVQMRGESRWHVPVPAILLTYYRNIKKRGDHLMFPEVRDPIFDAASLVRFRAAPADGDVRRLKYIPLDLFVAGISEALLEKKIDPNGIQTSAKYAFQRAMSVAPFDGMPAAETIENGPMLSNNAQRAGEDPFFRQWGILPQNLVGYNAGLFGTQSDDEYASVVTSIASRYRGTGAMPKFGAYFNLPLVNNALYSIELPRGSRAIPPTDEGDGKNVMVRAREIEAYYIGVRQLDIMGNIVGRKAGVSFNTMSDVHLHVKRSHSICPGGATPLYYTKNPEVDETAKTTSPNDPFARYIQCPGQPVMTNTRVSQVAANSSEVHRSILNTGL